MARLLRHGNSLGASRVFFVFNTFRISILDHTGTQCLISHNRRPLTKARLRRPLVVWNCIIFHVARRPPKQRSPLLSTGAVSMPCSTRPSTPATTGSIQKCILIAGPLINIFVALYQIYVTTTWQQTGSCLMRSQRICRHCLRG